MAIPLIAAAIIAGACGGNPPVYSVDRTISESGVIVKGSGSASATIQVNVSGDFESGSLSISPEFNDTLEWLRAGSASDYDVMCEYVSGDHLTSGTEDTWQALTSSRTYAVQVSGGVPDSASGTFNLKFRKTGSGSEIWSRTLTLTAEIT